MWLSLTTGSAFARVANLSMDTFMDSVYGRQNAFVKLFRPGCVHCEAMKEPWEKMGERFQDSDRVIIGSLDCDENMDLCVTFPVRTLPYLAYWSRETSPRGEEYRYQWGGEPELTKFVEDSLLNSCDIDRPADCGPKVARFIALVRSKDDPAYEDSQTLRLNRMRFNPNMTPEAKRFVYQRLAVLEQFREARDGGARLELRSEL